MGEERSCRIRRWHVVYDLQTPVVTAPIHVPPEAHFDDGALLAFCAAHPEWVIERTAERELVLMTPAGGETGRRNALITAALTVWAEAEGSGVAFDSSTGFRLPNSAVRSPDAAWVSRARLRTLTPEEGRQFLPLGPDFVVELRSPTDDLGTLQAKLEEYRANGTRLGWLIDPQERRVYRYLNDEPVERLDAPDEMVGEPVLPGFRLGLRSIRASGF
jgi:Uma2 family endonuclease